MWHQKEVKRVEKKKKKKSIDMAYMATGSTSISAVLVELVEFFFVVVVFFFCNLIQLFIYLFLGYIVPNFLPYRNYFWSVLQKRFTPFIKLINQSTINFGTAPLFCWIIHDWKFNPIKLVYYSHQYSAFNIVGLAFPCQFKL